MEVKKLTRSEQKRLAILNAAKSAFKEHGVQGTSMDQLASIAEVSKRTVYNHFESKEALVMVLISEMWKRATQDIDIQFSESMSPEEQLCRLLKEEIKVISSPEYIDLVRVAFGHFLYHPEALKHEVEKLAEQETALKRWIKEQIKSGFLRQTDTEFATQQLHSIIKGSCFWPQFMQIAAPLSKAEKDFLVQETTAMFLCYYRKSDQ